MPNLPEIKVEDCPSCSSGVLKWKRFTAQCDDCRGLGKLFICSECDELRRDCVCSCPKCSEERADCECEGEDEE